MTNKEAINKLKHCGVKEIRLAMEEIEKDLEVLKIFRNNEISISYLEESKSYDDYISKCDYFRCLTYITEEKYNKLKEWLKNETFETENRD